MVKYIVQVVRDADYEAQYRTLPVSEKPAIGKSLFGDHLDVEFEIDVCNFQANFNSERFIHRDVHQILNRRSHTSGGDLAIATALKTKQSTSNNDEIRDISQGTVSSRRRLLANDRSARQALPNLHNQLQAAVVNAQVLNDFGFQQRNNNSGSSNLSLGRDQLKTRMALKSQLLTLERAGALLHKSGTRSNNVWDTGNDFGFNCTSYDNHGAHDGSSNVFSANKGIVSNLTSSLMSSRSLLSLDTIVDFAFDVVHNRAGLQNLSRKKVDVSRSPVSKTVGARLSFSSRKESGFGTAPIWYQQSMENGPPLVKTFSLGN
jgi:hypothetical protein